MNSARLAVGLRHSQANLHLAIGQMRIQRALHFSRRRGTTDTCYRRSPVKDDAQMNQVHQPRTWINYAAQSGSTTFYSCTERETGVIQNVVVSNLNNLNKLSKLRVHQSQYPLRCIELCTSHLQLPRRFRYQPCEPRGGNHYHCRQCEGKHQLNQRHAMLAIEFDFFLLTQAFDRIFF